MEKTQICANLNRLPGDSQRRLSYTRMVMLLVGIEILVSIVVTLSVSALSNYIQDILKCIKILTIISVVIADMSALLLLAVPKIRLLLPLNLIILIVYTISASFMAGLPFACMSIPWELASWGTTLLLFFSTVVGGAFIRVNLMGYWLSIFLFLVFEFIAVLVTTIVLYTLVEFEIAMTVFGGGMAVMMIILAIISGQMTFGRPGLRTIDPDYCLASLILHAILLLLFVVSSVEFYFTLGADPSKCTNNISGFFHFVNTRFVCHSVIEWLTVVRYLF
uniref:Uncharacterized protein n=1 Tax=Trichobilharzia regenti TaxID=157069 RepID=A0AA85KBR2_TRIRE|nr:unnamed protein product [Trichobilharzia regenti]